MKSKLSKIGKVVFPEFTGERAYMIGINKGKPLPKEFSRWQSTVDSMLIGVETDDVIYMTIDQGFVEKGESQRRGGAHIDGIWIPSINAYSTGGHVVMGWKSSGGKWNTSNLTKGGIIIATDHDAPKAYKGGFKGVVGGGGDCSHINLSSGESLIMDLNTAYIGNVTMIHETVPAIKNVNRTFVRLTLPETYEFAA